MKTFLLTGPNKGATGEFGKFPFINGRCQVTDEDASQVARILCRYHGCIIEEENMVIHVWGPRTNNDWADRARFIARETWPGCRVELKASADFVPLTATVARCKGVIVVSGEDRIVQQYRNAGFEDDRIRVLPPELSGDVPDPNHGDARGKPSTSARVEAIPDAKKQDAPPPSIDDAKGEVQKDAQATAAAAAAEEATAAEPDPEVVARFLKLPVNDSKNKKTKGIRSMLKDEEMQPVFTAPFVAACLKAETEKARPRGDVVRKLKAKLASVEAAS